MINTNNNNKTNAGRNKNHFRINIKMSLGRFHETQTCIGKEPRKNEKQKREKEEYRLKRRSSAVLFLKEKYTS